MKIVIVKSSSLGDIIHVFPVLEFLCSRLSEVSIDWVVEAPLASLVQKHPLVKRVLCIDSKRWRKQWHLRSCRKEIRQFKQELKKVEYDLLLDLQGNCKSALITLVARAKKKVGFGFRTVSEWPNLLVTNEKYSPPPGKNIREDYLYPVQSLFSSLPKKNEVKTFLFTLSQEEKATLDQLVSSFSGRKNVLVAPGSAWKNKEMDLGALAHFLKGVQEKLSCAFFFSWGSEREKRRADHLSECFPKEGRVLDPLSLPLLQNLMAALDLVIAMDSLPLHLAGTTAVPTFALFGPSSLQKYNPLGKTHGAYQGSCPYGKTFHKRCPILRTCKTGHCIRGLPGQEVLNHFSTWWDQQSSLRHDYFF